MKNVKKIIVCSLFIVILIPGKKGLSHPHVFIAQKLHVIFDESGLSGIKVFWQFDDMFSSMIINDHDLNQNGRFEPDEVLSVKENAFSYISEFDYFFSFTIDGTPFKVNEVKDFNAQIIYGKLIYDFFIPCRVNATEQMKKLIIGSYDPNYYSAIYFVQNRPFSLFNAETFETYARIERDKDKLIYYDMVNPWTLFLSFRQNQ